MISECCRAGLRSQRSNPDWPYPYPPRTDDGLLLPAVWRGVELTDGEWEALAESTPVGMRVWEISAGTWTKEVFRYWESRARTREDVVRIIETELFPRHERRSYLPHLCGRLNCPGDEAHRHPFFAETPRPPERHPGVVRDAGKQPYDSWKGDNMVYVLFDDGARAVFPGAWLRKMAEEGDREMGVLQAEHDRKRNLRLAGGRGGAA